MSSIIVGVANQKGGVGETTSTVNLARALIELGKRVLVVDCAPQARFPSSPALIRRR